MLVLLLLIACNDGRSYNSADEASGHSAAHLDLAITRAPLTQSSPPTMAPMNSAFITHTELQIFSFSKDAEQTGRFGWFPAPVDMSHNTTQNAPTKNVFANNVLPDRFDLREIAQVSPIRDQGDCGACWAFASFGSLESFLLPEESLDFSEQHLKNNHGFALSPCEGGNIWMSMAYLTRWDGPHFEADDPYLPNEIITVSSGVPRKRVQEVILLPAKTAPLDHQHIKQALIDYGALYIAMCWDYDADGGWQQAYYYSTLEIPSYTCPPNTGHAVTLIGYDDTISADSFASPPPGDGAYLVKNSWGMDNGDDGYYYVSYHDGNFGYMTIAAVTAEPTDNFDHQYAYDPFGAVGFYGWGESNIGNPTWYAATFAATGAQQIDAVGTYARYAETEFFIDIYINSTADDPVSGTKIVADLPYTTTYPGYYTMPISQGETMIDAEDTFTVVIRVSSLADQSGFTVPVEQYQRHYSPNATSNPGETFTSLDGIGFFDLSDFKAGANIKVFTSDIGCSDDASCDDGDVCNGAEQCIDSECVAGAAIDCDNHIFCDGVEQCDPEAGCVSGDEIHCDDAIDCTEDVCDEDTKSCRHTVVHDRCDNGQFCDGAEICDASVGCIAGPAVLCDDGVDCTADRCDEEMDRCRYIPQNSICNNGVFCDGIERCNGSTGCIPGAPVNCEDGIDCTLDTCDADKDACVHIGVNSRCDNEQFCDGQEICDPQTGCQSGSEVRCDDGISCTIDTCDEAEDQCLHAPDNIQCNNGVFCDGLEICDQSNGCIPGPPAICDDGISCTDDTCDNTAKKCIHTPVDRYCDNGLHCDGEERCDPGKDCLPGEPVNCDDQINCTMDRCDENRDICVHTGINALCDDGNVCTVDICREQKGCVIDPVIGPCNDDLYCNGADICSLGTCVHTGDPCDVTEACNETFDICETLCDGCDISGTCYPDSAPDPSNPCRSCDISINTTDWTQETGTPCDDGNPCTDNVCEQGWCRTTLKPDGTSCVGENAACLKGQCIQQLPNPDIDTTPIFPTDTDTDTGQETESAPDTAGNAQTATDLEHYPHDTASEADSALEIETETNSSSDDTVPTKATDNDSEIIIVDTDTSVPSTNTQTDVDTDDQYFDDSGWDASIRPQDTSTLLDTQDMVVTQDSEDESEPGSNAETEQGPSIPAQFDTSTELALLESLANSGPFEAPDLGCGCSQVGHAKPYSGLFQLITGI